MPNVSYTQSNFQAGEFSPAYQGRIDDKEYPLGLALCLNYIPNQEGSLSPRSGFKRCGLTKHGSPSKLLPFRFDYFEPYVSEFTENNLRFWANGFPIFDHVYATLSSVTGNPPTFTVSSSLFGDTPVPTSWPDGCSVYCQLLSASAIEANGTLANREFTLTIVSRSAGTFTLSDAETGSPLTGTVTSLGNPRFYRVVDLDTDYAFVDDLRQVAFTAQTMVAPTNGATAAGESITYTGPEHKVSYIHAVHSPRSISKNKGLEYGLIREQFIDGPYFDSLGPNVPATVSGTTGSITVVLRGYSSLTRYVMGSVAYNSSDGFFYVSIVNPNIGHALPTTSPFINSFWARLPDFGWSSIISYGLGVAIYVNTNIGFTGTVYYSQVASNLNHDPTTDNGTHWSTTPVTWDNAATYPAYAIVISSGIRYVSVSVPVVGTAPAAAPTVWFPISSTFFEGAHDAVDGTTGYRQVSTLSTIFDAGDSAQNNVGRLIRLKCAPQPWSASWAYSTNDLVNYNDNIYIALASTTGDIPDQVPTKWSIQTATIFWTWGQITGVTDNFTATVLIKGADLPNSNPVFEWRLGLFSDAAGWPRCGVYHEGRLGFAGPIANRIDFGRSNLGYDFTPTAPDGTVADNNAIAYVLNSASDERVHSMTSTGEGVLVLTSEGEWLVSASNLNDPLTPTSIQAHPTTRFAAADKEACRLPSGVAFIQSGRRRLMEHRAFVDMTNYQSRLNASDLTRRCQHLTTDGILEAYYQRLPQPVIWAITDPIISTTAGDVCPPAGVWIRQTRDPNGGLFGMGYARTPDQNYIAPFSFEHGYDYTKSATTTYDSIAVQRGYQDTAEYLYGSLVKPDTGLSYIEMLMPVFESSPFSDTYNQNGTVKKFGMLSQAFMLDSGITPAGAKIATNGLSVTFYGLHAHAGETVSFTCRGVYVGDFAIAADGSVSVTFTSTFAKTDVGRAMYTVPNATLVPNSFQTFYLDKNGNTGVDEPATSSTGFYGVFGYKYRRRGQQLRPPVNGANGPAFGKLKQNSKIAIYVDKANEISIGSSFSNMMAVPLSTAGDGTGEGPGPNVPAMTAVDFVTGIWRTEPDDEDTFDGNLCWEQTSPVPGAVLAVGNFLGVEDI